MLIHQDWLVQNSQRKYPLDDRSTGAMDGGGLLPESILLDANIWVPRHVYNLSPLKELNYVYVSSVSISPNLVALTFLGCHLPAQPVNDLPPDEPELFTPLAVVSLSKPVVPYKNYALTPLMSGVKGWVVFGEYVQQDMFYALFSQPKQSMLVPRAVRFYDAFPIEHLSVETGFSQVVGDAKLIGTAPMTITAQTVKVAGVPTRALVFNLAADSNTLSSFTGPCGKRPESETCDKLPILAIAGVIPDCDGNIDIEFQTITVRWLNDGSGFCLDSDVNMEDVCGEKKGLPDNNGILPSELAWERPCNLTLPFVASLDPDSLNDEMIPEQGYWYSDGSKFYAVPFQYGAFAGPCFSSVPTGATSRVFAASLSISGTATGGMFVMALGLRKILIRSDGTVWKYALDGSMISLGSGAVLSNVKISANKIESGTFSYTFGAGDEYNQPQGYCGVYILGDPALVTGILELTSFTVTDIP